MRSGLRFIAISALLSLAVSEPVALLARAQDASGRPTSVAGQDDSGRPPTRAKKKTPPKKVIKAQPDEAVKVPSSSVIIRSYPPGADVIIDGRNVGTTGDDGELELSEVAIGPHRIVLHKDGYREWSQTVVIKSTTEAEEIEPLLQSENPQFVRDIAKIPAIEFGEEITGQITRDSIAARDGKTFYNEYVMKVEDPDAYVITLRGHGGKAELRLVDDSNIPYSIESLGEDVYQTVFVPHPGYYYVQVVSKLDESTFATDDYKLRVLTESAAHAARPISIGETMRGFLEITDRQASPGEFVDAWTLNGEAGTLVRIAASSDSDLIPSLTLLLDGKVVATSGKANAKDKKKKKKGNSSDGNGPAEIVTTLTGGSYTIFVRSASGSKTGAYELGVSLGG